MLWTSVRQEDRVLLVQYYITPGKKYPISKKKKKKRVVFHPNRRCQSRMFY